MARVGSRDYLQIDCFVARFPGSENFAYSYKLLVKPKRFRWCGAKRTTSSNATRAHSLPRQNLLRGFFCFCRSLLHLCLLRARARSFLTVSWFARIPRSYSHNLFFFPWPALLGLSLDETPRQACVKMPKQPHQPSRTCIGRRFPVDGERGRHASFSPQARTGTSRL